MGGQRRLLRSPRWTRLEPGLSSSRCSLSETSHHLLTSPRRSEESREQRAAQSRDLSVSRKAGELSFTSLYEYVKKNEIYAVNLKKKIRGWEGWPSSSLIYTLPSQDVHTAHPLRAGTDSNLPTPPTGLRINTTNR